MRFACPCVAAEKRRRGTLKEDGMQRKWIVLASVILAFLSGCGVSKDQYLKLEDEKKQLQQDADQLSKKVSQLEREKEELSDYTQSLQNENRRLLQKQTESAAKEESTPSEEPLK